MGNLGPIELGDNIYKLLRIRAEKHGISVEEEAYQILISFFSSSEKKGE